MRWGGPTGRVRGRATMPAPPRPPAAAPRADWTAEVAVTNSAGDRSAPGRRRSLPSPPVPDTANSITVWLDRLKAGDSAALGPLWDRYFRRLVRLADARLPTAGDADGADVAASASRSFWSAAAAGRCPDLTDRDNLWAILLRITERKVCDRYRRLGARKRPPASAAVADDPDALARAAPTPDESAVLAEEFQRLLDLLGDD